MTVEQTTMKMFSTIATASRWPKSRGVKIIASQDTEASTDPTIR